MTNVMMIRLDFISTRVKLSEKVEDCHMKNKVAEEVVDNCASLGKLFPSICGILKTGLAQLHSQ